MRAEIARVRCLNFAVGLLLLLGFLQSAQLGFGQNQVLLGRLDYQRLQPLLERLQLMALTDGAHAAGRDEQPALLQLIAAAQLPIGGLLIGHGDHRLFNRRVDPVGGEGLFSTQLL